MRLRVVKPALFLVLFLVAGCSDSDSGPPEPEGPKGTVTGQVTYNGTTINEGSLTLDSGKGYILGARINPDGSFELFGPNGREVVAGKYKVGVTPSLPLPTMPGERVSLPPQDTNALPEKFYSPYTSEVEVEIKEGEQDIVIELK